MVFLKPIFDTTQEKTPHIPARIMVNVQLRLSHGGEHEVLQGDGVLHPLNHTNTVEGEGAQAKNNKTSLSKQNHKPLKTL